RHKITDYGVVGTGLALTTEPWANVGPAWLDMLPEGAPIEPITVDQAGQPSTAVPGRNDIGVGELLKVQTSGGGLQYYLAGPDALRPITPLQYDIQRAYPATLAAYPGREPAAVALPPSSVSAARQLDPASAGADAAPATRPT